MGKLTTFYDSEDFLKAEHEAAKKTLSKFRKEFELYKRSFNLLSETVSYLLDSTKDKRTDYKETAVLSIMPRIIRSMQSIKNLTLKGYYYDVSVLERSLVESMGLCAYLALNEKEAENWIKGKDVKIAKIKLFDYVLKLLSIKNLDEESHRIYGELCGYVHTNARAIVSLFDFDYPWGQIGLKFTSVFDKDRVHEIASYPISMLAILTEIFHKRLPERKKAKIIKLLGECATERRLMRAR